MWMLVLESSLLGVFLGLDLVLFFVFFEFVLVPMYFIIAGWGHGRRVYAAFKFYLYTAGGSAFLLAGLLALAFLHAQDHALTFDLRTLSAWAPGGLSDGTAKVLFLAFFAAFAVKVPLFPLHTWLPDAHTEAPTAGSVILAGVLLKMGTYGFLRFSLPLFPDASVFFALTTQGLEGGVFTMISHGLTTGALFLLVGFLYDRRHTFNISDFGGLWKAAPVFGGIFLAVTFASIGLPGFSGFVGEFLALIGTFIVHRPYAVI